MKRDTSKLNCWMSKSLVTVEPSTSIEDAFDLMHKNNCRHLLVTDNGKLIGVVSNENLYIAIHDKKAYVDSVMSTEVITLKEDASLLEALKLFIGKKYSIVPVVQGDNFLVGVISNHDILVAFETMLLEKGTN